MAIVLKGKKKSVPKIFYPSSLSFRIEEIKSFWDKQKLKEIMTTEADLQKKLKMTIWVEKKDRRWEYEKSETKKQ